jgi:hypothetical protein
MKIKPVTSMVVLALLTGCAQTPEHRETRMLSIAEQGYFYVGGQYTKTADAQVMSGQMSVQYQMPLHRARARDPVSTGEPAYAVARNGCPR